MRWVPVAARLPHRCAFIPFVGSHDPHGFFQPDYELPGGDTPYVSVIAVREMAKMLGMEPAGTAAAGERALAAKDAEIAELREELSKAREKLSAVQVLKSAGYSASRKPGRPPREKAVT